MQLYVNDWLSSPRIQAMTPLEELAYFRMLLFCWSSGNCSISADVDVLAKLTRTDANTCSTVVQQAFNEHPTLPQRLTNKRLFELWEERQRYNEQRRLAGVKSGESRRLQQTNERSTSVEQALNSSSSSSSSSNSKTTNTTIARPTVEEIAAYCQERNNGIDPQSFYDYYSANGWKVGRQTMKDWRAAIRTWERNQKERKQPSQQLSRAEQRQAEMLEQERRMLRR